MEMLKFKFFTDSAGSGERERERVRLRGRISDKVDMNFRELARSGRCASDTPRLRCVSCTFSLLRPRADVSYKSVVKSPE